MALMRRITVLLMILLTAGFAFAAGQQEAGEEGEVTIDYSFWGNPTAIGVEEEIIGTFMESQD